MFIRKDVIHSHGAIYEFRGHPGNLWCQTQEGLGNKNWIAQWMAQYANGQGRDTYGESYYRWIGWDTALMAVNDVIAQGAMPIVYTDEVAAGDSEWFTDGVRSHELAEGYHDLCQLVGMALPAGESPSLRYLIKAEPPVTSAPSLSGCVTGIISPASRLVTGERLSVGDIIIAAPSTGLHCNGISLVINRALALPEQFLTKLPNGKTLGEEALIPTCSYVALVEALLEEKVEIHALLPGTGDGIAKIAFDDRPYHYYIHSWFKNIPPLFLFMRELGVSLRDCLTTFNWRGGYYLFLPRHEVTRTIEIGQKAGYDLLEVGRVEEGQRCVYFEPEDITLPPPGQ